MSAEPFTLTTRERIDPLWLRLRSHFESQLALARLQNDYDGPEFMTAKRRGHIECLKSLIRLGETPPSTG